MKKIIISITLCGILYALTPPIISTVITETEYVDGSKNQILQEEYIQLSPSHLEPEQAEFI